MALSIFVSSFIILSIVTVSKAASCTSFTPSRITTNLSTPAFCNDINTTAPFALIDRMNILTKHNLYRAQLANGCAEQLGAAFAPAGKNIKRLSYNCTLEASAQAWANGCNLANQPATARPGIGQTAYAVTSQSADVGNPVLTNFDYLWDKLKVYGSLTAANTALTNAGLTAWAQMAAAKSTSFGCGYNKCTHPVLGYMHLVICNYYPAGPAISESIYEAGSPCKVDSDCTTVGFATCYTTIGLCGVTVTTPTASPIVT